MPDAGSSRADRRYLRYFLTGLERPSEVERRCRSQGLDVLNWQRSVQVQVALGLAKGSGLIFRRAVGLHADRLLSGISRD